MDWFGFVIGTIVGHVFYWAFLSKYVSAWATARYERKYPKLEAIKVTPQEMASVTWEDLPLSIKNKLIEAHRFEREPHKDLDPIAWMVWNEQQKKVNN